MALALGAGEITIAEYQPIQIDGEPRLRQALAIRTLKIYVTWRLAASNSIQMCGSSLNGWVSRYQHPEAIAKDWRHFSGLDFVASYSSLEHAGLGRFGDLLDPWGDLR